MPKELVRGALGGQRRDDDFDGDSVSPLVSFDATVGWGDGTVQLGVEDADRRALTWVLYGGVTNRIGEQVRKHGALEFDDDEALGRSILNSIDVAGGVYSSLWATLDRDGINRLIRLLRKARDASFGSDA